MSSWLPNMIYPDGITKKIQVLFGGYNNNDSAQDGEIRDMTNMSGDLHPILAPRKPRYLVRTITKPNGFLAHDGYYWVDGTGLYSSSSASKRGTLTDGRKTMAVLGLHIVILPDKKYLRTGAKGTYASTAALSAAVTSPSAGDVYAVGASEPYELYTWDGTAWQDIGPEFGSIEAEKTASGTIQDGTFAGEAAQANTIYSEGAAWANKFKAGDAVTISGCTAHEENNKTIIIREIDGDYLRFYENSFVIGEGGDTETSIKISRTMPDMDFIFENENRLWGCKGDRIYASKLGDIFNWNVFDGLSTDSYAVDVGSAGDFTGACSYLGYPCFFKEESIYKLYGSKPSNFTAMRSASLGIQNGCGASPAIAGEVLFYMARTGIVAYSGGTPVSTAAPFGTVRYTDAVGGSDGTKYYVSMKDTQNKWHLFVFDTRTNLWHREDDAQAIAFGWNGELYMLTSDGKLWLTGNVRAAPSGATQEGAVSSSVEFGDFIEADPNKKGLSKLQIRAELTEGATMKIYLQYDSSGTWVEIKSLSAAKKRSYYIPIVPRRCDHFRIKITGTGEWKLYSLVREVYSGSEV